MNSSVLASVISETLTWIGTDELIFFRWFFSDCLSWQKLCLYSSSWNVLTRLLSETVSDVSGLRTGHVHNVDLSVPPINYDVQVFFFFKKSKTGFLFFSFCFWCVTHSVSIFLAEGKRSTSDQRPLHGEDCIETCHVLNISFIFPTKILFWKEFFHIPIQTGMHLKLIDGVENKEKSFFSK